MWWILYCAMQAVPAIDPTPHTAFDSQEKCFKQAEVSNSFGELHCVCADEPGGYRVIDANGLGLAHVDGEPRTPAPSRTSGYQNCRPERHLYLNPEILRLPKRMPVLEIARHLVCSKCGAIGDGFVHIRASMWSC